MENTKHPGLIRRAFTAEKKTIDPELGIYEGVITSETPDRTEDIIVATGGNLANYLKNPVVPFNHDYHALPVARALSLTVEPQRITARWEFAPKGIDPTLDAVRTLWANGFLSALSVGIWPTKWEMTEPGNAWSARRFTEWELLEFSIVVIPANPDALRMAYEHKALPGTYQTRYSQEVDHQKVQLAEIADSLIHLVHLLKEQ